MNNIHIEQEDMDTLVKMLKMAYGFANWSELHDLADKLYHVAISIYDQEQNSREKGDTFAASYERPLIYYVGFSHLMNGIAMQKVAKYTEARSYINKYKDLGSMKGLDQEGMKEVEYYKEAARANLYVINLLEGDSSVLPHYLKFLEENPKEVLPGLITMLEANRMTGVPISDAMHLFERNIERFNVNNEPTRVVYYLTLLYEYSMYLARSERPNDAINSLLQCLKESDRMGIISDYRKYVTLFEQLRDQASMEQINRYKSILEGAS